MERRRTRRRRSMARSNRRSKRRSKSRSKRRSDKRSRGRSGRVRGRGRRRGIRREGGGKSRIHTRSPSPSRDHWTDDHVPSYDDMMAKTDKYYKQHKSKGDSQKTYITVILMVFIAMIYITGIFDHGKTINDYITINEDGLDIAEKLGVGLIEYDSRIHQILDGAHSTPWKFLREQEIIKSPLIGDSVTSYNLRLNDNLQIDDINPYFTDIHDREPNFQTHKFGETKMEKDHIADILPARRDLIGYYGTREYVKQIRKDWRPKHKLQMSETPQGDINILLEKFMPKILSMAGIGIPEYIQFSGISTNAPRTLPPRPTLHQDIDALAEFGSASADHDYRIMLFDRDEDYDTTWTEVATEVDGNKANRFVKSSFAKYDLAKFIDFDVEKSEYIALIFDNNKVFHRTPPTTFWNWVTGNMPGKERRIVQFRISWDDYDQLDYEDVFNEKRFQEIMSGGGYRIV